MADEVGLNESSLGLCGKSCLLGELVECALVAAGGGAQWGGLRRVGIGESGQPGLQQPGVDVGQQHRVVQPGVGDSVAVGPRDADDQSVAAEPARGRPSSEVPAGAGPFPKKQPLGSLGLGVCLAPWTRDSGSSG